MIYHVCNRSIADFVIFNNPDEFSRMLMAVKYYQNCGRKISLSAFLKLKAPEWKTDGAPIRIIAYCLMPTHLHLVVSEEEGGDVSKFTSDVLNSYSRYFNIKHKRKGPLWESRSTYVLVKSDEQLLHVTRYVHLNPVTAYIVDKPEDWPYSSYNEYINNIKDAQRICRYSPELEINPMVYKRFVEEQIPYQRELASIYRNSNLVG